MIKDGKENNIITLVGKITSEKKESHEIYGEKFYVFDLEVMRLSGKEDIIPVTISERSITDFEIVPETKVKIDGQFRSYNSYEANKSRLVLTVFARDITEIEESEEQGEDLNEVELNGFICKKPIYRQTPFGREIADLLLAVNRAYNKSDYIPCISWGRNAKFCENLKVGQQVTIVGRVQSRIYEKKYDDGTIQTKVAYEVSVSRLELIREEEKSGNADAEENVDIG